MIVVRDIVLQLVLRFGDISRRATEHEKRLLLRRDVDRDRHVLLRVRRESSAVFIVILVLRRLVHVPDAAVTVTDLRDEIVGLGYGFWRSRVGGESGHGQRAPDNTQRRNC